MRPVVLALAFVASTLLQCKVSFVTGNDTSWPECTESNDDDQSSCAVPFCIDDCSLVDCYPELDPLDCPQGFSYEENVVYGGCCPACVSYLKLHDTCEMSTQEELAELAPLACSDNEKVLGESLVDVNGVFVPLVEKFACLHGLTCSAQTCFLAVTDECAYGSTVSRFTCLYEDYCYDKTLEDCTFQRWDPECDASGVYAPVQAKANENHVAERKQCFSPEGHSIYGAVEYNNDDEAEAMVCGCSRKFWELEQSLGSLIDPDQAYMAGRDDVSLHCQTNGDFEMLQCDNGRCWCVDEKTGRPTSSVVVDTLYKFLPCYTDEDTMGIQYLRRCESRKVGRTKVRQKLLLRGTSWEQNDIYDHVCDMDGSFGPYSCDTVQCFCTDKYGDQIDNYQTDKDNSKFMDCRCARDFKAGDTFLSCDLVTGAYNELQETSTYQYCVDEDGFPVTGYFPRNCSIPHCLKSAQECNENYDACPECDPDWCSPN